MAKGLSRFASLIGLTSAAPSAEADPAAIAAEKPTKRDDESDEDFEKRLKDWEDSQDDDDDEDAEDPKEDKDAKKKAKALIDTARAEGHAAGIAAERARWSGTLASAAAAGKPISAMSLLADTDMDAERVQKTLAALPAESGRTTLAARHPTPTPAPATDGGQGQPKEGTPGAFAANVAAAVAKVRGTKAA